MYGIVVDSVSDSLPTPLRSLQQDFIEPQHIKVKNAITERRSIVSTYTEEETTTMVQSYIADPTPETVEFLADTLSKSKKSIIGKLSREGVYRREIYVSKTGEKPITKVEIVGNIAENLGLEISTLAGLEKSPKASLRSLEKAVAGLEQIDNYPGGERR